MESGVEVVSEASTGWTMFLFITLFFSFIVFIISNLSNIKAIKENWEKYRCSPSIMPFASWYGYDAQENLNYCLSNVFSKNASGVLGPFGQIMAMILQILIQFSENINSIRIMIASLMGGVMKMINEFRSRFMFVMRQVGYTGHRLQLLMKRVYASMFSILYMGSSTITAGRNFGDTILFRFLDTFCFDPDTLIQIQGRGLIPIKQVQLGDVTENKEVVTSVYNFSAPGQAMVSFMGTHGPIHVSSNHYILYKGQWIMAGNHPNAIVASPWGSDNSRPLVCLDTDRHTIQIGGFTFSDYDETPESDVQTMKVVEKSVNNVLDEYPHGWLYQPSFDPSLRIKMKNGSYKHANKIQLGEELSLGRVAGIVHRHIHDYVIYHDYLLSPSALVWKDDEKKYVRAGKFLDVQHSLVPLVSMNFVVVSSATIETEHFVTRDLCEVQSPFMEEATSAVMEKKVEPETRGQE